MDFIQPADVYLINTCSVTSRTDYKSRNAIRKALQAKAENPAAKIIVTGCYSQINPSSIRELGEVDLIVDNNSKSSIFSKITTNDHSFQTVDQFSEFDDMDTFTMFEHTRAFIKIQDGCDFFCAYCTVPLGRGKPRSRTPEKVIEQIRTLADRGYREFVLGGVNLGLYGRDLPSGQNLENLLPEIEALSGVKLIRLSSLEPQFLTASLIQVLAGMQKLARHFHIPLQSGSDQLLISMKRHYSTSRFSEITASLMAAFPDAALGLDIIAGLPGETDRLFQETMDFLQDLKFTYLHVFPYSIRPGTLAAGMPDQVNGNTVNLHISRLLELSSRKKETYLKQLIADQTAITGIVEGREKDYWTGVSDHYIRFYLQEAGCLKGSYVRLKPEKILDDGLEVRLCD